MDCYNENLALRVQSLQFTVYSLQFRSSVKGKEWIDHLCDYERTVPISAKFRVSGLGHSGQGSGLRVTDLGSRGKGLEFRV